MDAINPSNSLALPDQQSVTPTGSDDLANNLLVSLTKNVDFTVPDIDLDDPDFQIPPATGPNYDAVHKLTDDDLTTGKVGGTGMFDQIMVSLVAHLKVEYSANRIAGAEYTKAYIGVIGAALQTASQYLLAKDQSYWQAVLIQQQARVAEIEVVKARVELEATKVGLAKLEFEAHTAEANYGLTKMQIANADAEFAGKVAQTAGVLYTTAHILPAQLAFQVEQTSGLDYTNTNILPAQLAHQKEVTQGLDYTNTNILPAQLAHQREVTQGVNYTNDFLLPAQLRQTDEQTQGLDYTNTYLLPEQLAHSKAQTATVVYTNTNLLPEQLRRSQAEVAAILYTNTNLLPANLAQTKAQTETIVYTNTNILPQQLKKSQEEVAQMHYTTTQMMPGQLAQLHAQTAGVIYTNANLMPAQLAQTTAQTAGVVYTNTNLLPQQLAQSREQVRGLVFTNTYILPAQKVGIDRTNENLASQGNGIDYTNANILPMQRKLINEQAEAQRAQTVDYRADVPTYAIRGAIGKQKALYDQQIVSYKRDAETKLVKMYTDAWLTQKTVDEDYSLPAQFSNTQISDVLKHLRTNLETMGVGP